MKATSSPALSGSTGATGNPIREARPEPYHSDAAEPIVAFVKELLTVLLIPEELHHLDPVDPLGEESIDRCQGLPHLEEEHAQPPADDLEHKEDWRRQQQQHEGQPRVQQEHRSQGAGNHQQVEDDVDEAHRECFTEGIDVRGGPGQQTSGRLPVEVALGKPEDFPVDARAQANDAALATPGESENITTLEQVSCNHCAQVEDGEGHQTVGHPRHDVLVDHLLENPRLHEAETGGGGREHQSQGEGPGVRPQVGPQAAQHSRLPHDAASSPLAARWLCTIQVSR